MKYFIIFGRYSEHKSCRKVVTILYSRFPKEFAGIDCGLYFDSEGTCLFIMPTLWLHVYAE